MIGLHSSSNERSFVIAKRYLWTVQASTLVVAVLSRRFTQVTTHDKVTFAGFVVLEGDDFQGVVTFRQLLACCLHDGRWREKTIAELAVLPRQMLAAKELGFPHKVLKVMHCQGLHWLPVIDGAGQWQGLVTKPLLQKSLGQLYLLDFIDFEAVLVRQNVAVFPEASLLVAAQVLLQQPTLAAIAITTPTSQMQGCLSYLEFLEACARGVDLKQAIAADWLKPSTLLVPQTMPLPKIAMAIQRSPVEQAWVTDEAGKLQGVITEQRLLECCDPVAQSLELQKIKPTPPSPQPSPQLLSRGDRQIADNPTFATLKSDPELLLPLTKAAPETNPTPKNLIASLQREGHFLTTMFDLTGVLLFVLDPQGRIVGFNAACESLTGYQFQEVQGQYLWELFLKAGDIKAMIREVSRLVKEKTPSTQEIDWRSRDGRFHSLSLSYTVLDSEQQQARYIMATGVDISDRLNLERTLKTLNQELEQRISERTIALNETQDNLRRQLAAVEAAVEAIAILENDQFVSVNSAFLQLFGYPHFLSLNHCSWQDLFDATEQTRLAAEISPQLQQAKSWQGEAIARRSDGSTFQQEVSLTLTTQGVLICVCRDITDRKTAENKLRQTEILLGSQYDNFPIPTYTWECRDRQFYLINYNSAADAANDHQLAHFLGQTSQVIYGEKHQIHCNIEKSFLEKRSFEANLKTQYRASTNQQLFLRFLVISYIFIPPNIVMVHTQDLTEQKRAEAKLRQNQAFLKQVIDNDPNLIFVKDIDGKFILVNQAVADLYGVETEDLIGKTEAEFNSCADEIERFLQTDRLTLRQQKTMVFPEEKVTDCLREIHYFRMIKIPLRSAKNNQYSQVLGVASDITQQRQAQKQLESALEQERQLNHLKSRFINTASHEFRTPLTVILGAAEILENYGETLTPERYAQHLKNIEVNAHRIEELIHNLLSMSRLEAGKLQCDRRATDITKLCEMIIADIKLSHGKYHDIELIIHHRNIPNPAMVDPDLLRYILSNLLTNACKYSSDHSRVTLNVNGDVHTLHFVVKDEGIGIPPVDQPHLFESFYRASNTNTVSGSGLGLNIVYEYTKLHGGTIRFTSELQVGSTFIVDIPLTV